jgi:hypothetical protein
MRKISPEKVETLLQQVKAKIEEISIYENDNTIIDKSLLTEFEYNVAFTFDAESHTSNLLKDGWSLPERDHIWSVGKYSDMLFKIPQTNKDLILEINGEPFLSPELDSQKVSVFFNNRLIANWPCNSSRNYSALVFNYLIQKDGVVHLKFVYENPRSPKSLGISNDLRILGFLFRSILIKEVF